MQPRETAVNISSLTENHGVPGSNPGPATTQNRLSIGYRSLVTPREGGFLCGRVPLCAAGWLSTWLSDRPVAMPEDRSSNTDTLSARRVGTGARRMPSSRKFEYGKLHCPGHMLSGVPMYRRELRSLESGGSGDHGVPKMGRPATPVPEEEAAFASPTMKTVSKSAIPATTAKSTSSLERAAASGP